MGPKLSTLTTVGYGDHVPVTAAGRVVASVIMITGVAVLGGVAAGVALIVARAVALAEEEALELEAESLELRQEARLEELDGRLARIVAHLDALGRRRTGAAAVCVDPLGRSDAEMEGDRNDGGH